MVQMWLYRLAGLLAALALARILFLVALRRPVLARTRASELGEMERAYDRDMYWVALTDNRPSAADNPFRRVLTRVDYRVDGVDYRADLNLLTLKGERPDSAPWLWYDPRDPRRVTGVGPSWYLLIVLAAGFLAVFASQLNF